MLTLVLFRGAGIGVDGIAPRCDGTKQKRVCDRAKFRMGVKQWPR